MEKVQDLRNKIDEIDERILCLLKERVDVCISLGEIKRELDLPLRDVQRENEHYMHIMSRASQVGLDPNRVKAVYQKIIAMSISAQESRSTKRGSTRSTERPLEER